MKHLNKAKRFLALFVTAAVLAGCSKADTSSGSSKAQESQKETGESAQPAEEAAVVEGQDVNNGRPFNRNPVKYDERDDKYLNGVNATRLPISDEEVVIDVWCAFSSTVMQGLEECKVFQEMEKRTNVKINWIYPPVGSEADNYTMLIASDSLPHVFITPPAYPGGETKAVNDEVYLDLTPYYEKGLMPNLQYLCETYEDINKDVFNDEGRILSFPMIDIVPASPWSGLWIRQDWLDELNMEVPETMEQWDEMLHAMKDLKGGHPLAINFKDWYGVQTNYMFAAAYECAFRQFINKDGKVVYGSAEPGYRDFMEQMNQWYEEGIMDPDFSTRTLEDYNAGIANGDFGAFGLAYGELGQQKMTGTALDPAWKAVPVKQPALSQGQTIHLRQDDSRVRTYRDYITVRAEEEGIAELIVQWKDYWYSQDGGDLCSYGVEGDSYQWKDGEIEWTDPSLTENEDADFWTLYPKFKLNNLGYLRDATSYTFEPEVFECINLWSEQKADWKMPDNISFTEEESNDLAGIMTDVNAYVEEMTYKFITGQTSLDEFDAYVEQLKAMNIDRAVEIYQSALDRYEK